MACMRQSFRAGVVLDGRYMSEEYIHAGSFGMVFKAKDMVTGNHVAIKCLTKRSVVDEADAEFAIDDSEELAFHQTLGSHRNIVNLITSFETDAHLYLVLEYCERGDLYEAIYHNTGPVETEKVRRIMLELIDAVEYTHSKGVYHRDIKPENIFLLDDMTVKLGDFGLSTTEEVSHENMVGSDRYMAPEQCESDGAGYSPEKADIWAVGIVLLNLLFSKNPFTKPTAEDPFFRDFCSSRETLSEIFFDISKDTYDVLEHCLNLNPAKRSLELTRDALLHVQSFANSCEDEDEFLTGSPRAQATANREPLGTPVIQSPMVEQGTWGENPFWTGALQTTLPQPIRTSKLSIVQEAGSYSEDLFGKSAESDWCSADTIQSHSLASTVDSNTGYVSRSSGFVLNLPGRSRNQPSAKNTSIAGSLPINMTQPKPVPSLSMIFGRKNDGPRSWSDMFEEDEEEAESETQQRVNALKENNARTFSYESTNDNPTSKVEDHRAVVTASEKPSVHDEESIVDDSSDKEDPADGFFMYEPPSPKRESPPATQTQWPRYNPPSKRSPAATMDRWAALGERRRAYAETQQESQSKRQSPITTSPTSTSNSTSGTKEFWNRRNFGFGNGNSFGVVQGGYQSTSSYHHSNSHNFYRNRDNQTGQSREACPWSRRNDYGAFTREGGRGDCRDLNWRRDKRQAFGNFGWVGGFVEARS